VYVVEWLPLNCIPERIVAVLGICFCLVDNYQSFVFILLVSNSFLGRTSVFINQTLLVFLIESLPPNWFHVHHLRKAYLLSVSQKHFCITLRTPLASLFRLQNCYFAYCGAIQKSPKTPPKPKLLSFFRQSLHVVSSHCKVMLFLLCLPHYFNLCQVFLRLLECF
jgi:hypothetical protein